MDISLDILGDGELQMTTTPLPASLLLFATGLSALGLLGWRTKRKASVTLLGTAYVDFSSSAAQLAASGGGRCD
jgi:hypothetical protein